MTICSPVQPSPAHISPIKEAVSVDKMINVGTRKEPSKKALDQFIKIYMEIAKAMKEKEELQK